MLTPEILRSVWPQNFQPPTRITLMNVEETAIWLEMVATFKGWTEGKAYAETFKSNVAPQRGALHPSTGPAKKAETT